MCCLPRLGPVCHSSSVSTCHLSAGLSSQRSPGTHRPCRGSHPRPSPARRSPRWGWTRSPCCAGSPAGRTPGWDSAAGDACGKKGRRAGVNPPGRHRNSNFYLPQQRCSRGTRPAQPGPAPTRSGHGVHEPS